MSRTMVLATGPQLQLGTLPHRADFSFRRHTKCFPGIPNIVLQRYRITVYFNACFWQRVECCRNATTPSIGTKFWRESSTGV